jgi:hypothetical protein
MEIPYYSYKRGSEWITPSDPMWSYGNWLETSEGDRGRWLRAINDYIVVMQDPYPEMSDTGLIHYAAGAMAHINHPATVLSVPSVKDKGPGFYESKEGKKDKFFRVDLKPGDRVSCIRFIAYERLPDPYNERLRLPRFGEIWGYLDAA